ncbi:MAG TPA: VIT1/CCC1 transporter family protein [Acidimicrobiales bacterium]|nr:VIT1/CCC1 transporter family protein [Acidimicrobiales bacterium]
MEEAANPGTPRPTVESGHEAPHRDVRGGGARAAVFGVSDGLVTNVSLMLGVAGASPGASFVRLAGLAGLVAGAFSMGAGEYVSMQAQRELFERELNVEREALHQSPQKERDELVAIYEGRGIDPGVARELVDEVMQDPDLALETHAREELGIDAKALGNPWQAAITSFAMFAIGAFIPLLPWLFSSGTAALVASIVLSGVAALTVGALLAVFTGRSRVRSALRQLGVTAVAAGITYAIGRAAGVSVH